MRWSDKDIEALLKKGAKITVDGKQVASMQELKETQKKKTGRAKYRNKKVYWDDKVFDSTKEYKRWRDLLLMLKSGDIAQLQRQVKYPLVVEGKKVAGYIADHVYVDAKTGHRIVEDVKSDITRKLPNYVLKKKLMKAIYNIEILEV